MKIIEFNSHADIVVEFQDYFKYKTRTTYNNFKKNIKNPYEKTVYGVGYIGEGYMAKVNGKNMPAYYRWQNMICRCYFEKRRKDYPAYEGCTMCNEWLNFQNFAKWYEENFYQVGTERMHVDKDILVKGNRVYSPETCIFVPQRINMMFMTKSKKTDLPTGISEYKDGYYAMYNTKYLGMFKELDNALDIYMKEKRIHIKEVATEYKEKIIPKLYEALINW